jgi:hypothetical protein
MATSRKFSRWKTCFRLSLGLVPIGELAQRDIKYWILKIYLSRLDFDLEKRSRHSRGALIGCRNASDPATASHCKTDRPQAK